MTDTISEAAVEAAAVQIYLAAGVSDDRTEETWARLGGAWKHYYRTTARAALSAAYPAIRAQVLEQAEKDAADEADDMLNAAVPDWSSADEINRYNAARGAARWLAQYRTATTEENQ